SPETHTVEGGGEVLHGMWDDDAEIRRSPTFQFPISSFAGMTGVSATLGMYCMGGAGDNKFVLRYHNQEGGGVVDYLDSTFQVVNLYMVSATDEGWQSHDVSASVQSAVDAGYDWVVFTTYFLDDNEGYYAAGEDQLGRGPYLDVTPEPTTLAFLIVGAAFLRGRRK
ncbi:MAG: PEP-CTERM sorting domain-containing protein, partial [Planctomycetes bacterium]|nr:PEP-CTERM sorting domain-containing protein [Planctomycetota bacterium]